MRVAIVGIGAMGSLFAARLAPLAQITLFGHWAEQLEALRQGLTLIEPTGKKRRVSVRATGDPSQIEPAEVVFVLVKSYQTRSVSPHLKAFLQPDGLAITLQNGLNNLEAIAAAVGTRRAILGITTDGATLLQPGVVGHAGRGVTHLGRNPQQESDHLQRIASLLRRGGFAAKVADDVDSIVWGKLVVNTAINPLTALLHVPNGALLENETARRLAAQAADESAAVAEAMGVMLPFADAPEHALDVARSTAHNRSSMLQDVLNGRPTEIESISGAVTRLGSEYGVQTPVNEALQQLIVAQTAAGDWFQALQNVPPHLRHAFSQLYHEVYDALDRDH